MSRRAWNSRMHTGWKVQRERYLELQAGMVEREQVQPPLVNLAKVALVRVQNIE